MTQRNRKRHAVEQPADNSYRLIPLTRGQNAIVDVEDFESLSRWDWTAFWNRTAQTFYAKRGDGNHTIYMHRVLSGCEPKEDCDHVNRNGIDNRKSNLRRCRRSENHRNRPKQRNNTSGFKGVSFDRIHRKWTAKLVANGETKVNARFASPEEAARAYDAGAKLYHGAFARLNFPN